jgi:imidazolonepropionase-like amidohydrolase
LVLLIANPVFQSLNSTIAFSLSPSSYYASNGIIFSSITNIKPPLLRDATTNDTVLVLAGPTLIDGTGDLPKQNALIIIEGNRIAEVINETDYYKQYYSFIKDEIRRVTVLNLTGKYVVPGLFDMHAHVAGVLKNSYDQNFSEKMLNMLLDYGVTTIRNPGGPTNQSIALKHNISEGNIRGPKIFTAGRLLNGPQTPIPFVEKQISSEEEAREEVRSQAAAGVDYVKLYVGLPPNLVKAAIDEAHIIGIKVIGHLYMTSWTDTANFGIDALTHGVPVDPLLLSADDGKRQKFYEKWWGSF